MSEKVIKRAKVLLKEAKTYTLGGKKFIKDVPVIVTGEANIKEFQANGYFKCTLLSDKKIESSDEKSEKSSSGSGSKKLLKKNKALKKARKP